MLVYFNEDGTIKNELAGEYLRSRWPDCEPEDSLSQINEKNKALLAGSVTGSLKKSLTAFVDLNNRIRKHILTLCFAEDCNNQAMWGLCGDESRGFCIEYSFPHETFLGQRMLLNLLPIYYGNKPQIKFFDVLERSITSKHVINGVSYEDYERCFLSAYTKDPTYSFQKEWRITFDERMGGSSQKFPFAKSIILGERMSESNKTRLTEIAKEKNIPVYVRTINKTNSKIVVKMISNNKL